MRHLLVTNDFPPKVGGIQSYLWELWRRLPPDETTVLTTPHRGAARFDAEQPIRVERDRARVLLPTRALVRRIDRLAAEVEADLVLLDPAVPLGLVGPRLERPYGVVLHGAEVTVPGRIPGPRSALRRVLRGAELVVAAGGYPADEAVRAAGVELPTVVVPPGVDVERFSVLSPDQRRQARVRLGLDPDALVVVGVSRLVPRKGFDVLVEAGAVLADRYPDLQVVVAGTGRDRRRLDRVAATHHSPTVMLGRVDDAELPALYGCADVFAMLCRNRWRGLEQEGFGIVFLEAAATGVASVAGRSGGSAEAVRDGVTGLVVDRPRDVAGVALALDRLLGDPARRAAMGREARARAEGEFTYDLLAERLRAAIEATVRSRPPRPTDEVPRLADDEDDV
ncbi:glycosyltransferase family 4 protein [Rhabdothermincola salaria]|uniref:glycosyltransferase family 4 protein n=1 Tax=Rhabdothermincola salaria TaxID=2903142 RepID=UPI001E2A29E6|nr:glycosyltransferase family 4 protein [Rhabdothermincola salaria]MCD9622438.1 glycosyltransferase family 4 protein [Rhabdothermincola salaria]